MLAVTLGAAPLQLDVSGCDAHFEPAALERQLKLEWADPPEGARVEVHCSETGWELVLTAPGKLERREQLALPELSRSSRARVLALLITERGRALTGLPPPEEPIAPLPIAPAVEERVALRPQASIAAEPAGPPSPSSPLRGSLFTAALADEAPSAWRVSLGAVTQAALWLGPARFGPQLRLQRGFLGLSANGAWGTVETKGGTVTLFSITAEPELTFACVRARWWQACGSAHGVFGYGAITATPLVPFTASRVDGPVLGGGLGLAMALRLTDWLALDLDGSAGGAWAPYGKIDGLPIAALGGAFASGSLSLVASWGGR